MLGEVCEPFGICGGGGGAGGGEGGAGELGGGVCEGLWEEGGGCGEV